MASINDMTVGSPTRDILKFAVPLICGYVLQQMYLIIDTAIVGRFVSVGALAAVGASTSVMFLIMGFCNGACAGFAIPVAQSFGAKALPTMRHYVANALRLSVVFAAVITIVPCLLCSPILRMINTPQEIFSDAYTYLVLQFAAIPFTFGYNLLSSFIRALGNSKQPFYFLIFSSIANIVLDFFFIIVMRLGVAGAAIATLLAQAMSAWLCYTYIKKKMPLLIPQGEERHYDHRKAMTLLNNGVPMGLQYSITAIGSVILQTAANTLGSAAVAAMTAGGRIVSFLACPYDAMGSTMATYGGQNVGAGKLERIGKGLKSCVILGAVYSAMALLIAVFLGDTLATLFVEKDELSIIGDVHKFLLLNTLFFFPLALVNIIRFLIQGMGFPKFAILAGVFEMVARSIAGFGLVPFIGFTGVCLGSPIAWIMADIFLIPAYFHVSKTLRKRMPQKEEPVKAAG